MITRQQKEEKVKEITEDFKSAKLVILTDYRGLSVGDINRLRRSLRDNNCKYKVVKNKLSKLAVKEAGYEELHEFFVGPTALAFNDTDPIEATKTILKWAKEFEHLTVKVGMLEGRILEIKDIEALGAIPSREVLLTRVCGGFQAPIYGLATVLQGNLNKLVYALDSIRRSKEAS